MAKISIKPKTAEQYVKLVDQAIIEIEEFISCLEFDMEDPGDQLRVLNPMLESVRDMRRSMSDGSYEFANQDLPFMEIANKLASQIPFSQLLVVINNTHRNGLDIESND